MTISSWPINERPREKLLSLGPKFLSDAELLAIFLRTGTHGKTALDLARELLIEFGNLKKLLTAAPQFFYQKPGIGKAKYALLKAAVELGRRNNEPTLSKGEMLGDSEVTKRFLTNRLKEYPYEVFAGLFLDNQNRLIHFEELFRGTLSEATIYPREVVKHCLAHNAAKIILAHNHPSGNSFPSQSDISLTKLLREALALIDVIIVDHIIIGENDNFSFAEAGFISSSR